ncbi:hypothetical protein [Primorskyibacter sp. 2E107]|uniref:hypothetical protein n=1 Tax=Primorskyibacter sp. 2E107 TaxID=3403458 RepID=UPI003AF8D0A3
MKIIFLSLMLSCGTGLNAMPNDVRDQAQRFASCLGRYSATMEHEWLLGRDGADALARRQMFEALLEAVAPDAKQAGLSSAQVLHIRIEAKFAQARLLSLASFATDRRQARHAQASAQRLMTSCRMLVLS